MVYQFSHIKICRVFNCFFIDNFPYSIYLDKKDKSIRKKYSKKTFSHIFDFIHYFYLIMYQELIMNLLYQAMLIIILRVFFLLG